MSRIRTHPGEVLRDEYLEPLGMRPRALGNRISDITRERHDVSAGTTIRLGCYFDTDPRCWLNLQAAHDLSKAQAKQECFAIRPRAA